MQAFVAFMQLHWGVISLLLYQAITAVIATQPEEPPATARDWWHWCFDSVHQFANLRNMRLALAPGLTLRGTLDTASIVQTHATFPTLPDPKQSAPGNPKP